MNFLKSMRNPCVVVKNSEAVVEKIRKLVEGGPEQLQMIVDFDYTLTRAHKDGASVECSWGVLENYKELPSSYHTQVKAAKDKYHPIELDLSISREEKVPVMIEWYKVANKCLAESGVQRSWLPRMVAESNCELRDGTETLLRSLDTASVPVLVMSAGVGDLIMEILSHFNVIFKNMSVVSNFLQFDHEGNIIGLSEKDEDVIHVYNKADVIRRRKVGEDCSRKNVILLGDSLGDLDMAAGVQNPNVVLTVGFLNRKTEANIETYQKNFDIVLVDDQTMEFPNTLLSEILGNNGN